MERLGWESFATMRSSASVKPEAEYIHPDDLVDMAAHRNSGALKVFVAYAQDSALYDENGYPRRVDAASYDAAPRLLKVNKFGKAYRDDARMWLHKHMADVVADAAAFMQHEYGWTTLLYDGLRTVDGAYNAYRGAQQSDLDDGLLSKPGLSAHNKGMAADMVQFDAEGKLVNMGGNFDHLDMKTNSRNNMDLDPEIIGNRRKREIAFQHAALSQGKLFAPLRSEFWDERFPENEADHWRVLESLCRCLGKQLLTPQDEANRRAPAGSEKREAFRQQWERISYNEFTQKWNERFDEQALRETLKLAPSVALPPEHSMVVYHGDFHPLYDRDLMASGKNITDNMLDLTLPPG